MNEKYVTIFGAVVLTISIGIGFYIARQGKEVTPPNKTQMNQQRNRVPRQRARRTRTCRSVTDSCEAKAEVFTPFCSMEKAKEKLRSELKNPLETKSCAPVETRLQEMCGSDCNFDFSTMLLVTGKTQFEKTFGPDEKGNCVVEGKRPITIKGNCVTK